jgi:hypothetical protein
MSQLQAAELGPFLTERLKHATQALVALPEDVFLFDPELAVEQLVDQFGYAELIVSDRAEVEPKGRRSPMRRTIAPASVPHGATYRCVFRSPDRPSCGLIGHRADLRRRAIPMSS